MKLSRPSLPDDLLLAQDPDPVRTILDFGGYVEGWATYTEMLSYYLAPVSKEVATIQQKNAPSSWVSMLWRILVSMKKAGPRRYPLLFLPVWNRR